MRYMCWLLPHGYPTPFYGRDKLIECVPTREQSASERGVAKA